MGEAGAAAISAFFKRPFSLHLSGRMKKK